MASKIFMLCEIIIFADMPMIQTFLQFFFGIQANIGGTNREQWNNDPVKKWWKWSRLQFYIGLKEEGKEKEREGNALDYNDT